MPAVHGKLEEIRGERFVSGPKLLAALVEMGIVPEFTTAVQITASVRAPATLSWEGYLTGVDAVTVAESLEFVDDPAQART